MDSWKETTRFHTARGDDRRHVMALLMTIAVPSFRDATLGSQLRAAANDLAAAVYLARSEAIKRNAIVTLCVSSDGATCAAGGWQQGWIVHSGGAVLQRQHAAPSGLKITAGAVTVLTFQSTGAGATAASFTVCRATPSPGNQERVLTVDVTGRPWIKSTSNGAC